MVVSFLNDTFYRPSRLNRYDCIDNSSNYILFSHLFVLFIFQKPRSVSFMQKDLGTAKRILTYDDARPHLFSSTKVESTKLSQFYFHLKI